MKLLSLPIAVCIIFFLPGILAQGSERTHGPSSPTLTPAKTTVPRTTSAIPTTTPETTDETSTDNPTETTTSPDVTSTTPPPGGMNLPPLFTLPANAPTLQPAVKVDSVKQWQAPTDYSKDYPWAPKNWTVTTIGIAVSAILPLAFLIYTVLLYSYFRCTWKAWGIEKDNEYSDNKVIENNSEDDILDIVNDGERYDTGESSEIEGRLY